MIVIILIITAVPSCKENPNNPTETKIEFARIPAGTFLMGNTGRFKSNEWELFNNVVTISKPFVISKYEITQEQWISLMGKDNNPSFYEGSNLPVEQVCWFQAVDFCNKLSIKEGLIPCYTIFMNGAQGLCDLKTTVTWDRNANGYRLPTEAEWEYVCKAGVYTDIYNGSITEVDCKFTDILLDKIAWYCNNSQGKLHQVGTKEPNKFGVYDMSGNVNEWCWDIYGEYPHTNVTDPIGLRTGDIRVVRGGSWNDPSFFCRSSFRAYSGYPYVKYRTIGFRIVRNI
jgi:formylglycine-generating enzyme required for sulfatase activity